MPGPLSTPASKLALDEVTRLFGDQVELLRASRWKLLSAFSRNRRDLDAAFGLLHALEMLGEREEAVVLANELWGRRFAMDTSERFTLAILHACIGNYDEALELTDTNIDALSESKKHLRNTIFSEAALVLWKLQDLKVAAVEDGADVSPFLQQLEACGLLEFMEERQALVNRLILPRQCYAQIDLGTDGDTGTLFCRNVYVTGDYRSRRELAENITDALAVFYKDRAIDEGCARSSVGEIVLPVSARFAGQESSAAAAF